ncbi:MAG: hypothetical protein CM1200mP34_4160 [Verrucomicrobiales bacterium]|nr:MAG: hypothetical protein CM1200mP34_4160 [Verrucomicrobiales bacterium]
MPKQRRPIFDYQIGDDLRVADYAEPAAGALPSITRRLRIRGNGEVWYLAAAGESITEEDGGYNIGGSMLRVSFPGTEGQAADPRERGPPGTAHPAQRRSQATLKQRYEWNL